MEDEKIILEYSTEPSTGIMLWSMKLSLFCDGIKEDNLEYSLYNESGLMGKLRKKYFTIVKKIETTTTEVIKF